jgi:magnesium-transporting ATPase (P-type)
VPSRVKRIYSSGFYKKKMATIYRDESGKLYLFVKGASGFLLPYCSYYINRNEQIESINASAKAKIQEAIKHFGKSNLRTLTLAYK